MTKKSFKLRSVIAGAICLVATMSISAQTSGRLGDNLTWALSGGTLIISGNGAMPAGMSPGTKSQPWNAVRSKITTVIIEDGVTTIGNGAFDGCTNLTSISIGNGITAIPNGCFTDCGLTSITIPERIATVDALAFIRCNKLETVYWNAVNCEDFSMGFYPFSDCNALRTVVFGDKVMTIPMAIFATATGLTSVTIGNSVTTIGRYAFFNCRNITQIVIPDNVQTIRTCAFEGCKGITSITLGSGLTEIHTSAFKGTGITEITIPEGVTAFNGGSVFQNCPRLRTVYFNAVSLSDLGLYNDFLDCPLLETFIFGDKVRRIPDKLLYDLKSLVSVTIGSRVTEIGRCAFTGCNNLEEIINKAVRPQTSHPLAFDGLDKSFITLRVPAASINAYKGVDLWKGFQIEAQ